VPAVLGAVKRQWPTAGSSWSAYCTCGVAVYLTMHWQPERRRRSGVDDYQTSPRAVDSDNSAAERSAHSAVVTWDCFYPLPDTGCFPTLRQLYFCHLLVPCVLYSCTVLQTNLKHVPCASIKNYLLSCDWNFKLHRKSKLLSITVSCCCRDVSDADVKTNIYVYRQPTGWYVLSTCDYPSTYKWCMNSMTK